MALQRRLGVTGLDTRLLEINEKTVFVHCHGNRLNLPLCATANKMKCVRDTISTVQNFMPYFNSYRTKKAAHWHCNCREILDGVLIVVLFLQFLKHWVMSKNFWKLWVMKIKHQLEQLHAACYDRFQSLSSFSFLVGWTTSIYNKQTQWISARLKNRRWSSCSIRRSIDAGKSA